MQMSSDVNKPRLVFRWNDPMQSFVFAETESAIRTDQIHRAVFKCEKWEKLKDCLHPADYTFILEMYFEYIDNEDAPVPVGEIDWDFFDQDTYTGAIFPAFLIYAMDEIIPLDVLNEYGTDEMLTDFGAYRQIKPEHLVPMITTLTKRGFEISPADDLVFDDFD